MIGNNKYIADIISKREDNPIQDVHLNEMILNEYWVYVKNRLKYSECSTVLLPHLGTFVCANNESRAIMRRFIKILRKYKDRENLGEGTLAFKKDIERQASALWKQIDALRNMFGARRARHISKKEQKLSK